MPPAHLITLGLFCELLPSGQRQNFGTASRINDPKTPKIALGIFFNLTCVLPHFEVHLSSSYLLSRKADLSSLFYAFSLISNV